MSEMKEGIFDKEYGYVNDDLEKKFFDKLKNGETLTGEEAALFVISEITSETHGNYSAQDLYHRWWNDQFEMTIKRKDPDCWICNKPIKSDDIISTNGGGSYHTHHDKEEKNKKGGRMIGNVRDAYPSL